MRLVLASTSRYRRRQLEGLGLDFWSEAPGVDEDREKNRVSNPETLSVLLAALKAEAVAARHPGAVVIGGDQLVALDGEILGKPGTPERAVDQLHRLSGRTHTLFTAVCVHSSSGVSTHLDRTRLSVRALDRAALERYVAHDEPLDCAGSYKFERGGAALFERVETEDPSAITGLPLIALVRLLTEAGLSVP